MVVHFIIHLFLGSVLPLYVTQGVFCLLSVRTNTILHKDDWKKFVTLAGGCAPEASTLSPVTVSQFF